MLVVFGLAFARLLPLPRAARRAGPAHRARAAAARASCSAARSPSARRRASAPILASALVLAATRARSLQGRVAARLRTRRARRSRSCSPRLVLRAGDGLLPLAPRSLPLLRDRRRRDPRRARPAALLRPDVVAAVGLNRLCSRSRLAAVELERPAGACRASARPGAARRRRRRRDAPARTARAGARAFSSCRSHPIRLPRPAWYQATATWTSPWKKSRSGPRRARHATSSSS